MLFAYYLVKLVIIFWLQI